MSYRRGAQADRRFAAFYYDDEGAVATSRSWLIDVDAVRARAYHSPAGWRLDVVGERARGTGWSVHVDVDADGVSHRLERQHGYPLDLDAIGHGLSVRFALVAAA